MNDHKISDALSSQQSKGSNSKSLLIYFKHLKFVDRGLIKKVETTLKEYELKNGGMNNQSFFKKQKLSQGDRLSHNESPMDSYEQARVPNHLSGPAKE